VKEIRLHRGLPGGGKAPSNDCQERRPSESHINHGEELIDTIILWESWKNKNRAPNSQRRRVLQIIGYVSVPVSYKSEERQSSKC